MTPTIAIGPLAFAAIERMWLEQQRDNPRVDIHRMAKIDLDDKILEQTPFGNIIYVRMTEYRHDVLAQRFQDDCAYCGNNDFRGKECQSCGAPR
jgi:hypothetical protein